MELVLSVQYLGTKQRMVQENEHIEVFRVRQENASNIMRAQIRAQFKNIKDSMPTCGMLQQGILRANPQLNHI
jgi:hypothetical protein